MTLTDRIAPYACGYCGSDLVLDGEILHAPDCAAPDPQGDEDAPDDAPVE